MGTAGVNTGKSMLITHLHYWCTFYLQIFSPLLYVLSVWGISSFFAVKQQIFIF